MEPEEIAPALARLPVLFVNAYFVGERAGPWTLVDSGLPHTAGLVRAAAAARFGAGTPPEAIVLTHGHFDHCGGAFELARDWSVPIYAAAAEMPYLTGRANYAPGDPTVGGFMGFMSRFMPYKARDLLPYVRALPANGELPGLPGWRRVETPGHSPGHLSFFREADRVLLAGDAFATTDLQSWTALPLGMKEVCRPPLPFTPDWESAQVSVRRLAALEPAVLAAGHGIPMGGAEALRQLHALAADCEPPARGRYVHLPARPVDESGYIPLPPPPPDPWPAAAVALALAGAMGAGFLLASGAGRRKV